MSSNCNHATCQGEACRRAKPEKKKYAIPKVSKKMKGLLGVYKELRKDFLQGHPLCEIGGENCGTQATEVHHLRGRGKYLNDQTTWKASCHSCNQEVERRDKWARENGHKLSRHEPINKRA